MTLARRPRLHRLAEQLGGLAFLDRPAEAVAGLVRGAIPRGPVKDAISGTPLGHPLHPLLTDIPIGTWTSAVLLDLIGGRGSRAASERLIAVGLLAAAPTAISGASDWADTTPSNDQVRRIGAVHAVANVTATALFAASLVARRRDHHRRGAALSLTAMGALSAGGHLGGHLSYAKAVGVDQTALAPTPETWADVLDDATLHEGELREAQADGQAIVLVRLRGRIHALADRCSHRGGPLHEGRLVGECVECPWHGSLFALADGSVQRGPSVFPQPAYATRVRDGRIHVRRA